MSEGGNTKQYQLHCGLVKRYTYTVINFLFHFHFPHFSFLPFFVVKRKGGGGCLVCSLGHIQRSDSIRMDNISSEFSRCTLHSLSISCFETNVIVLFFFIPFSFVFLVMQSLTS